MFVFLFVLLFFLVCIYNTYFLQKINQISYERLIFLYILWFNNTVYVCSANWSLQLIRHEKPKHLEIKW